jgi:hypothetical protein
MVEAPQMRRFQFQEHHWLYKSLLFMDYYYIFALLQVKLFVENNENRKYKPKAGCLS